MFETDNYLVSWEQSKYITASSFLFMFPAFYAYYTSQYFFAYFLFATTIFSANYWRKATFSWRRNADLVFAKISFALFFVNGVIHVKFLLYVISWYSFLILLVYYYYLSGQLHLQNNDNWVKYHVLFHMLSIFAILIVLDEMKQIKM